MKKILLLLMIITTYSNCLFAEMTYDIVGEISDKTLAVVFYSNNKEIGKTYINEKGDIIRKEGKMPTGIVKRYFGTDYLTEQNFKDGVKDGQAKQYTKGKLVGEWRMKNGRIDGTRKSYNEEGKLKLEMNFKDGMEEGVTTLFHGENSRTETTYKTGKVEGQKWYKNENIVKTVKDGKLEGVCKEYYKNGSIYSECMYKNGKKIGLERLYSDIGNVFEILTYKNGQIINKKDYDKYGILFSNQDYPEDEFFTDEGIIQGLSDAMRTAFFKTEKFVVLERFKMEELLKEQALQLTGVTKTEDAVRIGEVLNVKYIAIGSVSKIGKEYVVNVRIVSIESSEVMIADTIKCQYENELVDTVNKIIKGMSNKGIFAEDIKQNTIAVMEIEIK